MKAIKILILSLLFLSACRETIVHDVNETDANRIMAGLHAAGFAVQRERQADGRWSLQVPKNETLNAIRFLDSRRLLTSAPRESSASSSIIRDRDESRFRFERALSRELEYTLASIEGVLDVRVHLNLPERDPLLGRKLASAASGSGSVLLVVQNAKTINIDEVKQLVAGAGGISPEAINVLTSAAMQEESWLPVSVTNAMPDTLNKLEEKAAQNLNNITQQQPTLQRTTKNWINSAGLTEFNKKTFITMAAALLVLILLVRMLKRRKLSKVANILEASNAI